MFCFQKLIFLTFLLPFLSISFVEPAQRREVDEEMDVKLVTKKIASDPLKLKKISFDF